MSGKPPNFKGCLSDEKPDHTQTPPTKNRKIGHMPVAIDAPLTVWYCDVCDEPIVRTSEATRTDGRPGNVPPEKTGLVAWSNTRFKDKSLPERTISSDYKLVHVSTCDTNPNDATWHTDDLLGVEGLQRWSELLWNGAGTEPFQLAAGTTLNPSLDLLFRFQVPYYEQARRYLNTDAAHEILGGRVILSSEDWQEIIRRA